MWKPFWKWHRESKGYVLWSWWNRIRYAYCMARTERDFDARRQRREG